MYSAVDAMPNRSPCRSPLLSRNMPMPPPWRRCSAGCISSSAMTVSTSCSQRFSLPHRRGSDRNKRNPLYPADSSYPNPSRVRIPTYSSYFGCSCCSASSGWTDCSDHSGCCSCYQPDCCSDSENSLSSHHHLFSRFTCILSKIFSCIPCFSKKLSCQPLFPLI